MVLRPWLSKIALLTASAASSTAPIYWVMSSPNYKAIALYDANRYEVWHGAMRDEIQVLRYNNTWSLVPFRPSMNVIGSGLVYKIKHHVDGNVERYKACLVTRGFT